MRVLVADGTFLDRRFAEASLATLGIEARGVESKRQAIDALLDDEYDLVLLDTGLSGAADVEAATDSPVVPMAKPVRLDDLDRALTHARGR